LLFRYKTDSGELVVVDDQIDPFSLPALNENGSAIAYAAQTELDPAPQIYLWEETGSESALVSVAANGSAGAGRSFAPALSADGRKVAFVSGATNLLTGAVSPFPQVYLRDLDTEETRLISISSSGNPASWAGASQPHVSRDGTKVVFESASGHLSSIDRNGQSDIFLKNLGGTDLELVSVRDESVSQGSAPGFHVLPFVSASDGRFVVFSSSAANLVPGDTNGVEDVFLRDLWTGSTTLVSAHPDTGVPGNGRSWAPLLSGNGRYVVFLSQATNLRNVAQGGTAWGIFQKDLLLNQTRGIYLGTNIAPIGNVSAGDGSLVAWNLSHLGNRVVFMKRGSTFDVAWSSDGTVNVAGDANQTYNANARAPLLISSNGGFVVFGTDSGSRVSQQEVAFGSEPTLVSGNISGQPFTNIVRLEALSADDRFIAFSVTNAVYLHEIATRTDRLICTSCASPALAADASTAAYRRLVDGRWQIEVVHVASGETTPISVTQGGLDFGNADSGRPVITPDGRYVIFSSRASDLVENDYNNLPDVFVRDTLLQQTMLVSLNKEGSASGGGSSSRPVLASDGRTVIFYSFASDLVENDRNLNRDIFVLRLGSADSDGDGMDDDWEMAYFDTLDRDGTDDFDGDGHTDLEEFLAGTDPTDANSILRAMLLLAPDGTTTVLWHSVPGKSYRVEFKDGLDEGGWVGIPGVVQASGLTSSLRDETTSLAGQRFYRVLVLP
jgi:Tol biopolymer transport system component